MGNDRQIAARRERSRKSRGGEHHAVVQPGRRGEFVHDGGRAADSRHIVRREIDERGGGVDPLQAAEQDDGQPRFQDDAAALARPRGQRGRDHAPVGREGEVRGLTQPACSEIDRMEEAAPQEGFDVADPLDPVGAVSERESGVAVEARQMTEADRGHPRPAAPRQRFGNEVDVRLAGRPDVVARHEQER